MISSLGTALTFSRAQLVGSAPAPRVISPPRLPPPSSALPAIVANVHRIVATASAAAPAPLQRTASMPSMFGPIPQPSTGPTITASLNPSSLTFSRAQLTGQDGAASAIKRVVQGVLQKQILDRVNPVGLAPPRLPGMSDGSDPVGPSGAMSVDPGGSSGGAGGSTGGASSGDTGNVSAQVAAQLQNLTGGALSAQSAQTTYAQQQAGYDGGGGYAQGGSSGSAYGGGGGYGASSGASGDGGGSTGGGGILDAAARALDYEPKNSMGEAKILGMSLPLAVGGALAAAAGLWWALGKKKAPR